MLQNAAVQKHMGGLTSQMACLAVLNLQLDLLLLDIYTEKSIKLLSNISEQKHVFLKCN